MWITTRLRDEHRSALSWLNDRTDTSIRVFGIELGLVRIGQSAQAPVLDVVVEPNDWSKVAKQSAAASVSDLDQSRMAFFQLVFFQLEADYPVIRAPRAKAAGWWSLRLRTVRLLLPGFQPTGLPHRDLPRHRQQGQHQGPVSLP